MASLPRFIIIHAHGRKVTNHDLFPLAFPYVYDSIFHSLPKMFLAHTASLGGDRRFVMAFCKARKNPWEVSEASKGEMLAFTQASPCAGGVWGKEAEFPSMVETLVQSPAGLEEPLLRTPSIPVSQTHKHPSGGTTPAHP